MTNDHQISGQIVFNVQINLMKNSLKSNFLPINFIAIRPAICLHLRS